jgi:hypothetical protein
MLSYYRLQTLFDDAFMAPFGVPTEVGSVLEVVSKITEAVPRDARERFPADLSKNADHHIYRAESNNE